MAEKEPDESIKQEDNFLHRPFVEEEETPLIAIYEFDKHFSKGQLRDIASDISSQLKDKSIVIGDVCLDNVRDGVILIGLQRTNISYGEVKDLRSAGMKINGYEDLTISSVIPAEILRLEDR